MTYKSLIITVSILIISLATAGQIIGTFTDSRDDKTYKTVVISTQTWMAENLAYKAKGGCRAYGWDNGNKKSNILTYGYLYDWKTAKKACQQGWHLPNNEEWQTLLTNLGGQSIAGGKLKEAGTNHWNSPNTGATNESGFTALPGGLRDDKDFQFMGLYGMWWSFTEASEVEAHRLLIMSISGSADFGTNYKSFSHAVRCVKD